MQVTLYFRLVLSAVLLAAAVSASGEGSGPSRTVDTNRFPPQPQATACGDIVQQYLYQDEPFVPARQAILCLTSVPFIPAVAARIVDHLNQTIQYHATTAFVRDPPHSYQQPAFDFFGTLASILIKTQSGYYRNQYAFELEVQTAIKGLRDTHVYLAGGILDQFSFLSPFRFVSLSRDGKEAPMIYTYDDVIDEVEGRLLNAEPITEINGQKAADYLVAFAADQSYGMLEANADWNQLFESPAQELFGLNLIYEYAPFYAGDNMTIIYRNGTLDSGDWLSLYQPDVFTGSLKTGGDFYNFFVLGLPPASFDEEYATYRASHPLTLPILRIGLDESGAGSLSWHNDSPAYPNDPIMIQENLGIFASGSLTGYHLSDIDAAILSVPTFDFNGNGIETFSEAVDNFVANATQRNASTIIIDLQQNDGGLAVLALVLFSKFFPHDVPFTGSRMRSHPEANILGEILTKKYQSLPIKFPVNNVDDHDIDGLYGSEWVATNRINAATAHGFRSWAEYRGPIPDNGDNFTLTQRYNSSDPMFTYLLSTHAKLVYNGKGSHKPTWMASNITILTDGICGSTCSLFVEMMREQGVRSVVVGGLPEPGPMQAACGSRGAAAYTDKELFDDWDKAREADPIAGAVLPQRPFDSVIQGMTIGFTIRDQIRPNTSIPNQMLYLPADCRLYWTFSNIYSLTQLWKDAYNAIYVDQRSCVPGSLNATMPLPNHTIASPSHLGGIGYSIIKGLSNPENDVDLIDLLDDSVLGYVEDRSPTGDGSIIYGKCDPAGRCMRGQECFTMEFECRDPSTEIKGICSKVCIGERTGCGRGSCDVRGYVVSRMSNIANGRRIPQGFCHPGLTTFAGVRCTTLEANPGILADKLDR